MFRRISVLATALASCALVCLPAAASSAASETSAVRAGDSAFMTIALAAAASRCELTASSRGLAPVTLSEVRPTGPKITWTWQVPARALSATWSLSATCGSNQIGAVLTVHGQKSGIRALARQVNVLQYRNASSSPEPQSVRKAALAWWANASGSILADFDRGRSVRQCTAYAAARRPDIIERVDVWAYSKSLLSQGGALNVNWDAKNWAANAQRGGLPIGKTPRPGAVIVFQPGAYGATSLGHVAYVNSVGKDGSFAISEMHAPVLGRVTKRQFKAATARAMATGPGVSFIYR